MPGEGEAPSAGGTDPPDAVAVLELSGSKARRWWTARRAVRRLRRLADATRQGDATPLLLDAESGPAALPEVPRGTEVIGTADVLDGERVADVRREADDLVRQLVSGPWADLFPVHRGVHLGELNELSLRTDVAGCLLLARAAARLARREGAREVRIYGSSPGLADCLVHLLRDDLGGVAEVTGWSPRLADGALRAIGRAQEASSRLVEATRALVERGGGGPASSSPAAVSELPEASSVLFVAESWPMVEMFDRVRERMGPSGDGRPRLTVQYDGETGLEKIGPSDFVLHYRAAGRARERLHDASRIGAGEARAPDRGRAAESDGIAGLVGASELFRRRVDAFRRTRFGQQASHVDQAAALLDSVRPGLLVVGNDRWWVGQAFVRLARERDIPTLSMQDGVVAEPVQWSWAVADHVAANGRYLRQLLVDHGFPEDRVTVTGQPRYDQYRDIDLEGRRRSTRDELGLGDDAPLVLFPTEPEQTRAYVEGILDFVLQVSGVEVALRPHPSEPAALHRRLVSRDAARVHLCRDQGIVDLIAAADVAVVDDSTVGLEAAMLGRPVLDADFSRRPLPPHMKAAASRRAQTPSELVRMLEELLRAGDGRSPPAGGERRVSRSGPEDVRRSPTVEDLVGPLDGRASERVAELIGDLASPGGD